MAQRSEQRIADGAGSIFYQEKLMVALFVGWVLFSIPVALVAGKMFALQDTPAQEQLTQINLETING